MAKLFISYASDDRNFVEKLAAALTLAGHDVWFDRSLNAGPFRKQILVKLTQAEVAIVVWSARSEDSRYVIDESERAVARGVLLPIRIDDTDLPLGFGTLQTFDLSSWSGRADDAKFTVILDQVEKMLKNPTTPRERPAVPFITRSMLLAISLAAVCAPALAWLNALKLGQTFSREQGRSLVEAFGIAVVCTTAVMLWCGFEVHRFGLSHSTPILRRAVTIYAISTVAALGIAAAAIAGGVTKGLPPTAVLGQIGFVALLATLMLGALIAVLKTLGYLVRKLRM